MKIQHLFISFDFAYHESVSGSRILALNMELRFDYPDARIGFSLEQFLVGNFLRDSQYLSLLSQCIQIWTVDVTMNINGMHVLIHMYLALLKELDLNYADARTY